jgi:sugar-specific transcriptional regulator TrmB
MYEEILNKVGLTGDQAKIYEVLLKQGVMPASKASLNAGLKRGLGYKVIEQLVALGLVEKIDKKVALFAPAHPSKVKELIQRKSEEVKIAEASLSSTLGLMISDFNLNSGKPNIRFFEGEDGIKKVLEDSLYSREEILSYVDITSVQKYIPEINKWYIDQRFKKNIKKRGLLLDTPAAREMMKSHNTKLTFSRLIKFETKPFESTIQIYDGKVSYFTLKKGQMIGVIIEDPAIYEMHKSLFEFTWSKAEEVKSALPLNQKDTDNSQDDSDYI